MSEVLAPEVLLGKRALVTGAGSGIGRAIALRLGELGAQVIGVGRRLELLEETAALAGASFSARAVDLRDAGAVAEFAGGLDRLDVLVNNAGGQFIAAADAISSRGFAAVLDLNLTAVARLIELMRPLMASGASVINISLSEAERGLPGVAHSATERSAVAGLTRALAREQPDLRFYCLAPGTVLTDGKRAKHSPEDLDRIAATTPIVTPGEVAEWVAALAAGIAPRASGTVIELDGGTGLGYRPGLLAR